MFGSVEKRWPDTVTEEYDKTRNQFYYLANADGKSVQAFAKKVISNYKKIQGNKTAAQNKLMRQAVRASTKTIYIALNRHHNT